MKHKRWWKRFQTRASSHGVNTAVSLSSSPVMCSSLPSRFIELLWNLSTRHYKAQVNGCSCSERACNGLTEFEGKRLRLNLLIPPDVGQARCAATSRGYTLRRRDKIEEAALCRATAQVGSVSTNTQIKESNVKPAQANQSC